MEAPRATSTDTAGGLLALHVGLMLAGFAGLTLAGALAGLYLWQERRLKRRDTGLLRLRLPPLESLDRLSARTALISLVVLSAGIVVGLASFDRGDFDLPMAAALAIWLLYAVGLALRRERLLRGSAVRGAPRRRLRARRDRPPSHPLRLMRLTLVGVSHRQAPVELRERVAVGAHRRGAARRRAGRRLRGRCALDVQSDGALSRKRTTRATRSRNARSPRC